MPRSPVIFSGLAFALLALFSYHLFGWRLDGWILAFAAILHLALVLKWYPRLDRFLVGFHYLVALPGIAGVFWMFVDVGGTPHGSWSIFLSFFPDQWVKLSYYIFWGKYALVMAIIFSAIIIVVSWAIKKRRPRSGELMAELFVLSLLNIPCEIAILDTLYGMGAFRPERSRALIFAFGLDSLSSPVILHVLIVFLVTVIAWQHRRKKLSAS